jgi:hypothetical protein
LKRAAASKGTDAYQGAFEAVGSVLIACALGYWVDYRWDTAPIGLLVGAIVGFAAMVVRLLRMGQEVYPGGDAGAPGASIGDDLGTGEAPGLSEALRDETEDGGAGEPGDAGDKSDEADSERNGRQA